MLDKILVNGKGPNPQCPFKMLKLIPLDANNTTLFGWLYKLPAHGVLKHLFTQLRTNF